jgi:hypothetical protein
MFNHLGQELLFDVPTATLSGLTDASLRSVIEGSALEEGVLVVSGTSALTGSFGQREGRAARRHF